VARRLEHLASPAALDIRGLGPELIKTLVATKKARSPAELLRLTEADWSAVPGVGAAAKKLAAGVAESREKASVDGARLLYGLSLPGVGEGSAKKLAKAAGGFDELAGVAESVLGERAAMELFKYMRRDDVVAELRALAAEGLGNWRVEKGVLSGPMRGEVVVVTGAFSRWTRSEVVKKIEAVGGRVAADITRQTTLVVAGLGPGATLTKARARGVAVIDEEELAKRLEGVSGAVTPAEKTGDAPR
jgi:DNA ligase (NAD+)